MALAFVGAIAIVAGALCAFVLWLGHIIAKYVDPAPVQASPLPRNEQERRWEWEQEHGRPFTE